MLKYTGCDLSKQTVRGRTIARSGQVVGRTMSGLEALSLGVSQLLAAALPDVDEHMRHPLAPAGITLAGVAGVVGMSALAQRLNLDPDALRALIREAAKQAAKVDERAHEAPSAPDAPDAIPPDAVPVVTEDEAPAAPADTVSPGSEIVRVGGA